MSDPLTSRVGPITAADGSITQNRSGKYGEQIVAQAHGKYAEATLRGNVFSGVTAATGVAPGTALGTTAAYCLNNPKNSGKNLVIHKVAMGLISGTMGAGTVWLTSEADPTSTAPTGTAITPRNRLVGSGNNPVGLPLTTATVPTTAAKMTGILCSLSEEVVATATGPTEVVDKDIDGEIILTPGTSLCIHSTAAAGSSPLVVFSVTWEEVTIV